MTVKVHYNSKSARCIAGGALRLEGDQISISKNKHWNLVAHHEDTRWVGARKGIISSLSSPNKNVKFEALSGVSFSLRDPKGFILQLGSPTLLKRRDHDDTIAEFVYGIWHTTWGDRLKTIRLSDR